MHYVISEIDARRLGVIDRIEMCQAHGALAEDLAACSLHTDPDWRSAATWARTVGADRRLMILEA